MVKNPKIRSCDLDLCLTYDSQKTIKFVQLILSSKLESKTCSMLDSKIGRFYRLTKSANFIDLQTFPLERTV